MSLVENITKLPPVLYHGTTSNHIENLSKGIDLSKCTERTDFAKGFYLTSNIYQAKKWAFRKEREHNLSELRLQKRYQGYIPKLVKGVVCYFEVDLQALERLNGFCMKSADLEWARFVYANRSEKTLGSDFIHNRNGLFDYVYGPVADGNMIMPLTFQLDEGKIGLNEYRKGILNNKYIEDGYNQLSLHSESALKLINYKKVVLTHEYNHRKKRVPS